MQLYTKNTRKPLPPGSESETLLRKYKPAKSVAVIGKDLAQAIDTPASTEDVQVIIQPLTQGPECFHWPVSGQLVETYVSNWTFAYEIRLINTLINEGAAVVHSYYLPAHSDHPRYEPIVTPNSGRAAA